MTEEELGAAMLALAREEGHRPQKPPKMHTQKLGRTLAGASPQTIKMMRILRERDASTQELADAVGIRVDPASWRLKGLERGSFVDAVGSTESRAGRATHVWRLGPRGDEWLKAYGQ